MKTLFYHLLSLLTRYLGLWFFSLVAGGIATGYFFLFPRRVAISMRFYKALFPERSRIYYYWCTFRQFIDFTYVFRDRLLFADENKIKFQHDGLEALSQAKNTCGGVLLMSHVGNWEVGARLLIKRLPDLRLMLYMGIKEKEQIEKLQKQTVQQHGIRVIGVDASSGSPLDIVEGIRFLRSGGMVSLTGDRLWQKEQRTLSVRFIGRTLEFPAAPYVLAMAAGAPILVFFAFRTGPRCYHCYAPPPIRVTAADRSRRQAVMRDAAQKYADHLEVAVRHHPFQWHHFEPFLDT